MGPFLKWYFYNLKSRPMTFNLGSAVVLMTVGDVMAQEMERHHVGDRLTGSNPGLIGVPARRRLSLRRYGTHGQPLTPTHNSDDDDDDDDSDPLFPGPPSHLRYDGAKSTSKWHIAAQILWDSAKTEVQYLDYFRTGTMIVWSTGVNTMSFLQLYKFCDRIFPKQNLRTVTGRVVISLMLSIPMNALFFVYGTSVHHTAEWVALRRELKIELQDMGLASSAINDIMKNDPPFDWEMLVAKTKLKLQSEYVTTMTAAAKVWIPVNFLNFAVMPPHLRPLATMLFSVFWNCYLSLVQHRDVPLPVDV